MVPGSWVLKYNTFSFTLTIGEKAFQNIRVEKLIIPESVLKIGKDAFGNVEIKKILIPDNVKEIGTGNFKHDTITAPRTKSGALDMRYNGVSITVNTNTIIYCYPGSCAQDYARSNGLECHSYLDYC